MRALRGAKQAGTAALVAALVAPGAAGVPFVGPLPEGLPDVTGWEKITGSAELTEPAVQVDYEFYVNPEFYGRYEVVRFRIRTSSDLFGEGYRPTERLRWQVGALDVRRYECEPRAGGGACRWRELSKGGSEYQSEARVTMWLFGLHRRLVDERDAGRLPE